MTTRSRTLTAIGLAPREELLVRALLKVVNAKTIDAWSFHDDLEANVALCNPDSALSLIAIKRAISHGLLCVSVVHEGGRVLPETLTLRAPIRGHDFVDLLNQASGQLQQVNGARRPAPEPRQETVAQALRRLRAQGNVSYVRIDVEGRILTAALTAGRLGAKHELSDAQSIAMGVCRTFRLTVLDDATGEAAMAAAHSVSSLDRLWWLSGLHGASNGSTDVSADSRYQLRRWPDAGQLQLQSIQLKMAAALTRQAMTASELASKAQCPLLEAKAFMSGCAMLGLLNEASTPSHAAAFAARAARPSRYSELFQSLRAVFGIRA